MIGLRQLKIKSKVTIVLLLVSLGSVGVISFLTWQRAKTILTQRIFEQLTSVRASKSAEIESYFEFMYAQMKTLAEDRMIIAAMVEFDRAFTNLNQPITLDENQDSDTPENFDPGFIAEEDEENPETAVTEIPPAWKQAIENYYTEEFLPRLAQNIDGEPIVEIYKPKERAALYLQYHYIANNPKPVGEKDELMRANDNSEYSKIHALYHPPLRNLIKEFGYYDLFLIDPDTGHIIYSVYKETDFATSLKDGPYANSNFAAVVDATRKNPEPSAVQIVDFASYRPSYGAPAAFFATPIYDGSQKVGILAAQLPVDRINKVLTGNRNWQNEGLGESGEVYLVGSDYLMRSISRFLIEDRTGYLEALENLGVPEETIKDIDRLDTSILLQTVKTEAVLAAFQGEQGTKIIDDYRGIPVLSSYKLVDIKGVNWVILAEMDLAEAYAPLYNLQQYILTISVVLVLVVTSIALFSANTLLKPISLLIEDARKIAVGDFQESSLKSLAQDELSSLVESFNDVIRNLKEQKELVKIKEQENRKLLHRIVPKSVADRLRVGDKKITQVTEQATVLLAEIEGLTQLSKQWLIEEYAEILHGLINGFNEAAEKLDVLPLTPVGELYFAVCGLAVPRLDHAKRVMDLSLEILDGVRGFNHKYGCDLGVRIGIASGEMMAAAIDGKYLNYYIWGKSFLIAEHLNRYGSRGTIRVTEEVYDSLKDLYIFEESKESEIYSELGRVKTWQINQEKERS